MVRVTSPVEGYTGPGPGGVVFEDGVAETDNEAVLAYFRRAGYGVDGAEATQPETPVPAVDARDAEGETKVGAPLRDAAVNPRPEDFLPPVNAGQADPHGPRVVAPGVHALPPGPIIPGDVGAVAVRAQESTEATQCPAKSAKVDEWKAYARHVDPDLSEEDADALTKPELIERYGK